MMFDLQEDEQHFLFGSSKTKFRYIFQKDRGEEWFYVVGILPSPEHGEARVDPTPCQILAHRVQHFQNHAQSVAILESYKSVP